MTKIPPLVKADRIRRFVKRDVLNRRLPHGLLGPCYLWPFHQDQRIRLHRHIWWQSHPRWPRPLWLVLETWLWLRWMSWYAIPACRRTVRRLGPVVVAEEAIPEDVQFRRILKLALLWAIPPSDSYRFRLYRNTDRALDYIFNSETQGYHTLRNNALKCSESSLTLLQDKKGLTEKLSSLGIPFVQNLAVITQPAASVNLSSYLETNGRLFCKTNSGNQGRGAFTVWKTPDGMGGRTFAGTDLPDTCAVEKAWDALLQLDTVLIQPCLENHSALAKMSWNEDVITVRFISIWQEIENKLNGGRVECLSATLEIPTGQDENGNTLYTVLPIDPAAGSLAAPIRPLSENAKVLSMIDHARDLASEISALPDWEQITALTFQAHQLFTDVRAIAWDWVVTPDGPVLLEGNVGWSCATPQVLGGGFLSSVE